MIAKLLVISAATALLQEVLIKVALAIGGTC